MKYASFLIVLAIFSACSSTSPKAHKKADTTITVAVFDNPYHDQFTPGLGLDSCFRIIKDSVHVGEEKNTIVPDTVYYIRTVFPIYDKTDPTRTKKLKNKAGADSAIISFMPVSPRYIIYDFSIPTPYHSTPYHITPPNK
jgi:hypothetical protein